MKNTKLTNQSTLVKRSNQTQILFNINRIASAITVAIVSASVSFSSAAAINASNEVNSGANSGADDSIERIVVSSDFAQRSPNNLASSVTVIGEQLLDLRQAEQLEDIVGIVPNLNFTSGASRGRFIQIRGIGERSVFSEPINASVALVVDEINFSGLGGLGALFDVQQVEVLSGPQSTGFGATGLAGMIKIVSNATTDVQEGYLQGSFAQYNTQRLSAAYSNQLADGLNARVAMQQVNSDGFVENIYLGRDDTSNLDEFNAKLALDYTISDSAELELKLYHFDVDNGYDAFSLDNDNKTRSDEPGFDRTDTQAASIKYIQDFKEHSFSLALTTLNADLDYGYDEDWTFVGFHPSAYSSFDQYKRNIRNQTIDARYASSDPKSPWVIGFYYQQSEQDLTRFYTYAETNFTSLYKPESAAVYGEYSWQVSEPLLITAGARAEKFDADYIDSNGFVEVLDDNLLAAKLSASYVIQKTTFYSSVSRSYKAGGFNADERVLENDRLFSPEYNWNYELGIKGKVNAANGITGNVSLTFFYMQREDAQVSDFSVLNRQDGSGAVEFIDVIGNADTGINKGMEVTTDWQFSDKLSAVVNVGYLDATFGNYQRVDGSFVDKQLQAQAPKISFYVSSRYDLSDDLAWVVEFEGKDRHRFSVGHNERAPFTAVFNTEINWQQGNTLVQLWAKNIFDREIPTRGFGGFNNDPRDNYDPAEPYYQFGQERQVGITATYRF